MSQNYLLLEVTQPECIILRLEILSLNKCVHFRENCVFLTVLNGFNAERGKVPAGGISFSCLKVLKLEGSSMFFYFICMTPEICRGTRLHILPSNFLLHSRMSQVSGLYLSHCCLSTGLLSCLRLLQQLILRFQMESAHLLLSLKGPVSYG